MAESIVTYIEKNTPIVQDTAGDYFLVKDGKREKLTPEQLTLHKQLLALPWNNVYTTNYDPLLEASVDIKLYDRLIEKNKKLYDEIIHLEREMQKHTEGKETLETELAAIRVKILPDLEGAPVGTETSLLGKDKKRIKLEAEIGKLTLSINRLITERDLKNKEINSNEESLNNCYTVVTDGAKLQLKRNRNIIKLHGSLRNDSERAENKFEFDGDPHKQYVISAEHYGTYPKLHEAFTQLMRISLLQESYCLVGFSGVDPNFNAWIGWVRDLLHKHAARSGKPDNTYKIFLIDMSEDETQPDRLLFNENHSILRIPLLMPNIISFLEKECKQKIDQANQVKSVLHLLVQFLGDHESIILQIANKDKSAEEQWRNVFAKLLDHTNGITVNNNNIDESLKALQEVVGKILIPNQQFVYTYNQEAFLQIIEQDLLEEHDTDRRTKKLLLALICLSKYFVPIRDWFPLHLISELSTNSSTGIGAAQLLERNSALIVETQPDGFMTEDFYNDILHCAFSFRFDELKIKLDNWQPPVLQLHLKAGFLAWFNPKNAVALLQDQIASDLIMEEQRLYSLELLSYIQRNENLGDNDKRVELRIKQYEKAGYPSFIKAIREIGDELSKQPDKVNPFGSERFSVSSTIRFSHSSPAKHALQYLMILVDSGFPLSLRHMHLQNPNEWYLIFKQGFEFYPFPYLYYSLQYSNESILKRIGQDVAFSDNLVSKHTLLLSVIGESYFAIHSYRKQSVLIFLSETLISVAPAHWETLFVRIWDDLLRTRKLFAVRNTACESFVNAGFRFMEKESIFFSIIMDILPFLEQYSELVISYLYTINNNVLFTKHRQSPVPDKLVKLIDELVLNVHLQPENSLFALGNLNFLLSEAQLSAIQRELEITDFSAIKNERIWHIIVFFARGDHSLHAKIKEAIITHPSLWDTGIRDSSVSGGFKMLRLHTLTDKHNQKDGLVFSPAEILELYNKMKIAFEEIRRVFEKHSINGFSFQLEEMVLFLDMYQSELYVLQNFTELKESITSLYNKDRGYAELMDGLSSPDHSVVVWALAEFSSQVENGNINSAAISLVLNKLFLQAPPAIEESLNYLAAWIKDKRHATVFENNHAVIVKILQKFKDSPLAEADIPFVEEMLIRIAYALRNTEPASEIVNEWIAKGIASRYNNIRQWVMNNDQ
jgi:hypothetical protein